MITTTTTPSAGDENCEDDVTKPQKVGHLLKEPTEVECPACHKTGMTRIEREAVTCLQRLVSVLNCCLICCPIRWTGRHDINHYCSNCGCFIGRFITLSCYKRWFFKLHGSEQEEDNKWQRFQKVRKEELDKRKQQTLQKNVNGTDEEQE